MVYDVEGHTGKDTPCPDSGTSSQLACLGICALQNMPWLLGGEGIWSVDSAAHVILKAAGLQVFRSSWCGADGAHAGICLETPQPIIAAMERIMNVPVRAMHASPCTAPANSLTTRIRVLGPTHLEDSATVPADLSASRVLHHVITCTVFLSNFHIDSSGEWH